MRKPRMEARASREVLALSGEELLDRLGFRSASGSVVNEGTALTVSTVWACVSVLSDMVAKLPCKLYRKTDTGRQEATDHPAHALVSLRPGFDSTPFELKREMQTGLGLGGNGYARVWRDRFYQPAELQWIMPAQIQPKRTTSGAAVYELNGERNLLTRADIVHVKSLSTDGIAGISPIRAMRETVGMALTQRKQIAKVFANGARFPGFLVSPASQTPDQIKQNREEWQKQHGGADNAGKTPLLWGGWDYKEVSGMTMEDAEFLESRKFERSEIEIAYRVPGVLIGDNEKTTSWGTGIEQMNLGFLNYCLDPWLVNWEQSLGLTLLSDEEVRSGKLYFKFTREALLAVALEAKGNFFRTMRDIGVYNVNDVRAKLEENDLSGPEGTSYQQPFNGSGGTAPVHAATPAQPKDTP